MDLQKKILFKLWKELLMSQRRNEEKWNPTRMTEIPWSFLTHKIQDSHTGHGEKSIYFVELNILPRYIYIEDSECSYESRCHDRCNQALHQAWWNLNIIGSMIEGEQGGSNLTSWTNQSASLL